MTHPSRRLTMQALEDRLAPAAAGLVRDINTGVGPGAQPGNLVDVNGIVYFTATTPATGTELWRSDGTSSGTTLVRDIWPGSPPSLPANLTNVSGILFFSASDGVTGQELWRSDGTSSGTLVVRDELSEVVPQLFCNVSGILYYQGNLNSLFRSDGTSSGTTLVRAGIAPRTLTNVGGTLFFRGCDAANGNELWRSDGTSSGTVLVKDIRPGTGGSIGIAAGSLVNFAGTLLMSANDGVNGYELWRSDGTSSGTTLVADIRPGAADSISAGQPLASIAIGDVCYFGANDGATGQELWRSDGTSSGTFLVRDIRSGAASGVLLGTAFSSANVGGVLMLVANDGTTGQEIWRSDGTSSGTYLVKDIGAFSATPSALTEVSGALFFYHNDFFNGYELWRSNGTSTGTTLVRDIAPGTASSFAFPRSFINRGGTLFFSANDNVNGTQLWRSDGSSSGTAPVKSFAVGTGSGTPQALTEVNGSLFFLANRPGNFVDLWKSDGTSSGTVLVNAFNSLSFGVSPGAMANVNGIVYFQAMDSVNGLELWRSDGTSSGTFLVKDVRPGISSSAPYLLMNVGGTLFFAANDGTAGNEWWRSDGTSSGTMLVKDIRPGLSGSFNVNNFLNNRMAVVGDLLYFIANDGVSGTELWRSDGTSTGTFLVKDIRAGSTTTYIDYLTNFNGLLAFQANDGVSGRELWRSDGTSSGTILVRDTRPGIPGGYARFMINDGGILYFSANDGIHGFELWRSDATSSGTWLVCDVNPGSAASSPLLSNSGGIQVFRASHSVSGYEIWRSDGTSSGTGLIRDIRTGPAGSIAFNNRDFKKLGDQYYFLADDGIHHRTMWRSDGTSSGTFLVGTQPIEVFDHSLFTLVGDSLFFNAVAESVGSELFKLPLIARIRTTSGNGSYGIGQTVNITIDFSEPATLAGGDLTLALSSGGMVTLTPFSGTTATGTYTVAAGHSSPHLTVIDLSLATGATLRDAAGRDADLLPPVSNLAQNSTLVINPLTVAGLNVNASLPQRSRIVSVQVQFSTTTDVSLFQNPGAVTLTRTSSGSLYTVTIGSGLIVTPGAGTSNTITLTFQNVSMGSVENGSLADGRWQLAVPSLDYQSTLDDPTLRRLFGDVDANGTVDGSDFSAFGSAFGSTGGNIAFDIDNNATIDGLDFAAFGARFGLTL